MRSGVPPRASAAHREYELLGAPPSPSLPWWPHALGAGGRSGGLLISVRPPSGSRALRARWEPPSGSWRPPHRGLSHWCSHGSPPDSLLRAMGARCWVGVTPTPPPPCRPLTLGARDRSGGTLSSVSPSAVSLSELALLGFLSPPSSRCFLPLLIVAPWPFSAGAGPALDWPPTDDAAASFLYSRRRCMSLSVVAVAVTVECAGWGPAPPAPSAVPSPRPASPLRLVVPCRLRHWAVALWLLGRWAGFRPLSPTPVRPPPVGIRTLWGIPGFRLPWVPHLF